jgi:hypothetical protein
VAKSHNGWRKLSGSAKRKIEKFLSLGERAVRRQFVAARRRELKRGTLYE